MRLLAALLITLLSFGCTDRQDSVDDTSQALRIVSLAPHLTELLFSVGAGEQIVGVVAYSDYPAAAKNLPVIGDAFRIDPERLAAVEPDLVFAWQGGNPQEVIDQLQSRGYEVISLPADTIDDVTQNLIRIGELTGFDKLSRELAQNFSQSLEQLAAKHATNLKLDVFYQISRQPLYTIGGDHPISDLIELCGGRNIFDDLSQLAPVVSLEDVLLRDPDVIITGTDSGQLDHWRRWKNLSAVHADNLYLVDASLVTRSSLRLLQGASQICSHLAAAREKRY